MMKQAEGPLPKDTALAVVAMLPRKKPGPRGKGDYTEDRTMTKGRHRRTRGRGSARRKAARPDCVAGKTKEIRNTEKELNSIPGKNESEGVRMWPKGHMRNPVKWADIALIYYLSNDFSCNVKNGILKVPTV